MSAFGGPPSDRSSRLMGPDTPNRTTQGPRPAPQLVFGLVVAIVGVLFMLDNLGIANASQYARYWPVGLILVGLVKLWQSRDGDGGAFAGLIFTAGGVWLLLEALTVIRISFFELWPLLLVFFGGYLVWQGFTQRPRTVAAAAADAAAAEAAAAEATETPAAVSVPDSPKGTTDSDATINAVAILGGVARGNNSRHFRGGDVTAIMGGCEIDLRQAAIHGHATIDLFTMWGGIEIRVPDEWTVESQVVAVLGGVEDKTRPRQGATAHRLTLRGLALMGGVEIKN